MTTRTLTDAALTDAGLEAVLVARREGTSAERFRDQLERADLLVLGALADRVRKEEVGAVVRVRPRMSDEHVVSPAASEPAQRGIGLLRQVAMRRILGAEASPVAVDLTECGPGLAEVALSFGASELVGPMVSKRGLPIADDKTKRVKGEGNVAVVRLMQKELGEIIRRAGREPVFIDAQAGETSK